MLIVTQKLDPTKFKFALYVPSDQDDGVAGEETASDDDILNEKILSDMTDMESDLESSLVLTEAESEAAIHAVEQSDSDVQFDPLLIRSKTEFAPPTSKIDKKMLEKSEVAVDLFENISQRRGLREFAPLLVSDIFKGIPLQAFVVFCLSLLNAILAIVSSSLLYLALSLFSGNAITIPLINRQIEAGPSQLAIVFVAFMSATIFAAINRYLVRQKVVKLGINYYEELLKDCSEIVLKMRRNVAYVPLNVPEIVLRSVFSSDVRYASAAFSQILSLILPLFIIFAALIVLAVLNLTLFAIVVGLLLVGGIPIYMWLISMGHSSAVRLQRASQKNSIDKSNYVTALMQGNKAWEGDDKFIDDWFEKGDTRTFLKELHIRQLLSDRASLATNILTSIAVAGIITAAIFIGNDAQAGNVNIHIPVLFTALLAFRYLATNIQVVISSVTTLYSNLPFFFKILAFRTWGMQFENDAFHKRILDAETSEVSPESETPEMDAKQSASEPAKADAQTEAKNPSTLIFSYAPISWSSALKVTHLFYPYVRSSSDIVLASSLITPVYWNLEDDLTGRLWKLPKDYAEFLEIFPESADRSEGYLSSLEKLKSRPISHDSYNRFSREMRFLFAFKTAIESQAPVIAINGDDTQYLSAEERKWIVEQSEGRTLMYFYTSAPGRLWQEDLNSLYYYANNKVELIGSASLYSVLIEDLRTRLRGDEMSARSMLGDQGDTL